MATGKIVLSPFVVRRDVVDGGAYQIDGVITELGTAGSYRVRLHDQLTGRRIRETWSDTDGSYSFTDLDDKPKYVIAFDHSSPVQRAAIEDNVVPS